MKSSLIVGGGSLKGVPGTSSGPHCLTPHRYLSSRAGGFSSHAAVWGLSWSGCRGWGVDPSPRPPVAELGERGWREKETYPGWRHGEVRWGGVGEGEYSRQRAHLSPVCDTGGSAVIFRFLSPDFPPHPLPFLSSDWAVGVGFAGTSRPQRRASFSEGL